MKVKVLTDIQVNGRHIQGGTLADISEGSALRLIQLGWAEEEKVAEEIKAPKKATKKK